METWVEQAGAQLRQARQMLAAPWSSGPESFQAALAGAVECLRSAAKDSAVDSGQVEIGVRQLRRELRNVAALLAGAEDIAGGWSRTAALFAGIYGRDAEAVAVSPLPRVSIRA